MSQVTPLNLGTLTTYRSVALGAMLEFGVDPLNVGGALATGGRYNIPKDLPDAFGVLYLAEHLAVAHAEVRGLNAQGGPGGVNITPPGPAAPRLDVCITATLTRVLDLTDPAVLATLGVTQADLTCIWVDLNGEDQVAPTQALALAALRSNRFDSVRYESTQYPGGVNYAVFPDHVHPSCNVHDPGGHVAAFARLVAQERQRAASATYIILQSGKLSRFRKFRRWRIKK